MEPMWPWTWQLKGWGSSQKTSRLWTALRIQMSESFSSRLSSWNMRSNSRSKPRLRERERRRCSRSRRPWLESRRRALLQNRGVERKMNFSIPSRNRLSQLQPTRLPSLEGFSRTTRVAEDHWEVFNSSSRQAQVSESSKISLKDWTKDIMIIMTTLNWHQGLVFSQSCLQLTLSNVSTPSWDSMAKT